MVNEIIYSNIIFIKILVQYDTIPYEIINNNNPNIMLPV